MKITHKILESVSSVVADMAGFTLTTTCHAYTLDNNGSDDAKIYFNDDAVNYYLLKAGASKDFSTDSLNELLYSTIKITFNTAIGPRVDVVKQTKSLIS